MRENATFRSVQFLSDAQWMATQQLQETRRILDLQKPILLPEDFSSNSTATEAQTRTSGLLMLLIMHVVATNCI